MALCLSLSKFIISRQNVILNLLILPSLSNEFMEEYSAPTWIPLSSYYHLIVIILSSYCHHIVIILSSYCHLDVKQERWIVNCYITISQHSCEPFDQRNTFQTQTITLKTMGCKCRSFSHWTYQELLILNNYK